MPRKAKAVQAELLPPEDQSTKGRKTMVEAEHTIKYSAPVPVTIEETEGDDSEEVEFIEAEETEKRRRRKTAKDERDDLRRELDKLGVASVSRLKLSIDKYRHSDSDDSGTLAEKDYCTKYPVTKEHILNDDYMDVARRYGPGRYWFTLRMDNKIARQWERQVSQAVTPGSPVIQHADPNSPQVIVNMPEGMAAQQPVGIVDPMKQMRELAKTYKELKAAFEPESDKSDKPTMTGATSDDAEILLLKNLAGNDKFMDKISTGLIGKVLGKDAMADEPSITAVAMEAVKTGQLASSIDAVFRGITSIVKTVIPNWGNQNGQTQMGAPPIQNHGTESQNQSTQSPSPLHEIQSPQTQPQGATDMAQAGAHANGQQQQMTPEEQALGLLIDHCRRQIPPKVAFGRLIAYADVVNEQYPQGSIDDYIEMLGTMPTDAVIEFVKTLPNGEQIAALPHCREWCVELQKLIRESQEGAEE